MKLIEITDPYKDVNKPHELEDILVKLKSTYSQAYNAFLENEENILYRGQTDVGSFVETNAHTVSRKSINLVSNHYTDLFSNRLASWKHLPKRSNCIICTSSRRDAKDYMKESSGRVYLVFPKNNTEIARANAADFWSSFGPGLAKINELVLFRKFYNAIDLDAPEISRRTIHSLEDFESMIDLCLKTSDRPFDDFLSAKVLNKSILEWFDELLSPDENKIAVVKPGDFINSSKECWFSNDAILIDYKKQSQIR